MRNTKPTTGWAYASLVSSGLGLLAGVPLLLIDYGSLIGGTAGVGVILPLLLGLVSAALALAGALLGLIALARTTSGQFGGRGIAWAGVALGGALTLAYLLVLAVVFVGVDVLGG